MAKLKIEISKNIFRTIEVKKQLVIGRAQDNDIVVRDAIVARHHARVYPENGEIVFEDLNSPGGIFVNGGDRCFLRELQDGDFFEIGKAKIYFSTASSNPPAKVVDLMTTDISEIELNELLPLSDIQFVFPSDDQTIQQIYEIAQEKFETIELLTAIEKINLNAALNKCIGNAQRHGHKYNSSLLIKLRFLVEENRLVIVTEDQGNGFDCQKEFFRKQVDGEIYLSDFSKLGDEIEYNYKGNEVTITQFFRRTIKGKSLREIDSLTHYEGCSFYLNEAKGYYIEKSEFKNCSFRSNVKFSGLESCHFSNCSFNGKLDLLELGSRIPGYIFSNLLTSLHINYLDYFPEKIAKSSTLKVLELKNHHLSDEELKKLQKHLSNCKIIASAFVKEDLDSGFVVHPGEEGFIIEPD